MISKSSIHIDHGYRGNYAHNSRESFSHSQVFSDEKNEYDNNVEVAFEKYERELSLRGAEYLKKTGQRLQSKTVTHLSAIINLLNHHSFDDLGLICNHLEKTLDTIITQLAIHRDEGKLIHILTGEKLTSGIDFFMNLSNNKLFYDKEYTEELDETKWKVEKNYHAHIEMLGIDSNGNAIKRNKLNKYYLMELQNFVAVTLGMERGKCVESYTKEQMRNIKSEMKQREEYTNKKDYSVAFNHVSKKLGYFIKKKKRLDTHEFKAKMKSQNDLDNEKRKALETLEEKNKQLKAIQLLSLEREKEIAVLKQKILDYKFVIGEADRKKISDELNISRLKSENKVLEENNYSLSYANGWKRKGEPVLKDDLIKHLHERNVKLASEKQGYAVQFEALTEENTQMKIKHQGIKEDIENRDATIEILNSKVNNLEDQIGVLMGRIQEMTKDEQVSFQKKSSISQSVNIPRIRF